MRDRIHYHFIDAEIKRIPELRAMDRGAARRWYESCQRDAAANLPAWLRVIQWAVILSGLLLVAFALYMHAKGIRANGGLNVLLGPLQIVWVVLWFRHIRQRTKSRTESLLRDGRWLVCCACDYDLRGTPGDACPECGESVWVADWERRIQK